MRRLFGRDRGFAFAKYKNLAAYCAIAIELEVEHETGQVRLLRAVAAVDSGEAVNPDGIRNQIEGGIVQSASWSMHESVVFDRTRIISRDWSSYPILRFADLFQSVDVHVIDRPGQPFLGLVLGGAAVCVLVLLFALWFPVERRVSHLQDSVRTKQADLAWLQSVAPQLSALQSAASSSGGQSLVVIVDGVAHQTGIARSVSGSQPGDDGTLSVRLEQVPFDSLVNWAGELVQHHGVRVVSASIDGSAKGTPSWIPVQEATVYFDHPVHAQHDHTLNIDFRAPDRGPSARVAVELSAQSARELVARFNLEPFLNQMIESLSHGTRQRVAIVSALLHAPEVFVLDEPMVGLDPHHARVLKDVLKENSRAGMTIFISTHQLSLAEEMADRIGIIHQGRLIAAGSREELRRQSGTEGPLEQTFLELTEPVGGGHAADPR